MERIRFFNSANSCSLAAVFIIILLSSVQLFSGTDCPLTDQELDKPAVLLQPGTSIPERINNPRFWREWIENERGSRLPAAFQKVAEIFKEEGERLGIFWPGVLVQSSHETNFYRYGGRADAANFNVGGVGITLDDVTTTRQNFHYLRNGIRAMLEHVAVYADPYLMKQKIQEQNYREKGTRDFTGDRTNKTYDTIRKKYDVFRRNNATRPVRFIDLGAWATAAQLAGRNGFSRYNPIRNRIGGATLTYAGDPFYGAKFYEKWHKGIKFVAKKYKDSMAGNLIPTTVNVASELVNSGEGIWKLEVKVNDDKNKPVNSGCLKFYATGGSFSDSGKVRDFKTTMISGEYIKGWISEPGKKHKIFIRYIGKPVKTRPPKVYQDSTTSVELPKDTIKLSTVFIIDGSSSMTGAKLASAKSGVRTALASYQGLAADEEWALYVFSGCGNCQLLQAFTSNPADITSKLGFSARGSTPIAYSLKVASNYLRSNGRGIKGRIILLSDGGETCKGDPVKAAKAIHTEEKYFDLSN